MHCQRQAPAKQLWQTRIHGEISFDQDVAHYAGLLDDLMQQVRDQTRGGYIPVSVTLADPWVKQTLLAFETLPKNRSAIDRLIQWRLEKDWHFDMAKQQLRWQILGAQQNQQWVVAQTCSNALIVPLQDAARKYQLMLDSLDAAGNVLLNRLDTPHNTLLIIAQPDHWTVVLLDEQGWPRYRRAKWQSGMPDEQGLTAWTANIDRMLSSFHAIAIEQIILLDAEPESERVSAALQTRFNKPVNRIDSLPCRIGSDESPLHRMARLALEAA